MAPKFCKVCEKTKDSKEDFYARNGRVCRDCRSYQATEHKKAVGGKVIEMLEKILENQRISEEKLHERLHELEDELTKMRRKLKKMAIE